MNTFDLPPVPPVAPAPMSEPRKWYQIWWEVWRYPGSDTFRAILAEPNTTTGRASLWILLTSFVLAIFSSVANLLFLNTRSSVAFTVICGLIGVPIFAVIGIYISTAIYHGVSRLFGSSGRYDQLFFCFAAIQAPESILGIVTYLFYPFFSAALTTGKLQAIAIPLLCLSGFALLVGLYSLVLFVMAVAGAENLTTGKAILAVLFPTLLVMALFGCIGFAIAAAVARNVQYAPFNF